MHRIFMTTLWAILIVVGIILMIPYAILDVTIDKIDDWIENVELRITDEPNKIDNTIGRNKNGSNVEL